MNLYEPPRRGPVLAITLLSVGFLTSSAIAVWEYVELQRAEDRIEELEAGDGGSGGILGGLEEVFEDAFGDLGQSLGGEAGALFGCLFPQEPFSAQPVGDLPVEQQVAAIARGVEELRELRFEDAIHPEFVSPDQTTSRVQDLFLEEYTEAIGDAEERVLTALGAIPPGTELRSLRSEALGEQVAGFYDPQTGELVVRQAGADLSLPDRVVLAHELDHALTDQALGLPVPDDLRSGHEDADLAASALAEGDATLVMQLYSASLPLEEQFQGLDPSAFIEAIQAQEDVAQLPAYLQRELTFPYEQGLAFVCDLYQEGGWEAVDGAYADPPASTLEILFPDRYREGFDPVDPRDPGALRDQWRRAATMQLGAAHLLWLFEAPGGDPSTASPDPKGAVDGWEGGELHLWTSGQESAVGIALESDGSGLCQAVMDWYRAAFDDDRETAGTTMMRAVGGRQDAQISCTDDEVRVGIAPTLRTAKALSA